MVTIMFDELDPDLAKAFAQERGSLGGDEFMAKVLLNIERARRARMRRWALAVAVLGVLAALNMRLVLDTAAAVVRFVGDFSPADMDMMISPAGWAVSMLIGTWVLFRTRPSRR
jgi:hypothetical protein